MVWCLADDSVWPLFSRRFPKHWEIPVWRDGIIELLGLSSKAYPSAFLSLLSAQPGSCVDSNSSFIHLMDTLFSPPRKPFASLWLEMAAVCFVYSSNLYMTPSVPPLWYIMTGPGPSSKPLLPMNKQSSPCHKPETWYVLREITSPLMPWYWSKWGHLRELWVCL